MGDTTRIRNGDDHPVDLGRRKHPTVTSRDHNVLGNAVRRAMTEARFTGTLTRKDRQDSRHDATAGWQSYLP